MNRLDAYLFDGVRTPRGAGKPNGALAGVKPVDLLAPLYRALRDRTGVAPEQVEDVVLGCSVQTGEQGTNLAKISALYAGFGESCSGVTLNRFCASGLDALSYAALKVSSGMESLVLAGGVESLSRVGMFADGGPWFSDPEVAKATRFLHMGVAADVVAALNGITRADADGYALSSQRRATQAWEEGRFARSVVKVTDRAGRTLLERDELVRPQTTAEKLAALPPAFEQFAADAWPLIQQAYPSLSKLPAIHHVGCAPGLADGASLLLVGSRAAGERLGLKPRARILAFGNASVNPVEMLTGPAPATRKALQLAGVGAGDVDRYECNESFSAPVIAFMRALELDPAKVNVNGGAIAMGHPLGATGGMLTLTLVDELERCGAGLGCVTICAGAGIAQSLVIERC